MPDGRWSTLEGGRPGSDGRPLVGNKGGALTDTDQDATARLIDHLDASGPVLTNDDLGVDVFVTFAPSSCDRSASGTSSSKTTWTSGT